jgi:hypothetical protein
MDKLGLPYDEVMKCVNNSFKGGNHTRVDNDIFKEENEYWKSYGPHFFPAIIINNVTYRGFLNPEHVFEAICEGFETAPSECKSDSKNTINIIEGLSITT